MSRSRFVSPLSEEEQRGLEELHCAGRSHRVRQRAHAVLLSAQGYTLDQAADILRIDRDAISRTLDRWRRGALSALEEGERPGRPPKVDAGTVAEVVAAAQESPASLPRTLAKRGRSLSPATTQ